MSRKLSKPRRSRLPKHNLENQRFGRLVALRRTRIDRSRSWRWLCICDCGKEAEINERCLLDGKTVSCGCFRATFIGQHNLKHGMTKSPEYRVWSQMKRRCYDTNARGYERYGARGIVVCDRWRESFTAFLEDVGCRPSPSHSLDRVDNAGSYCAANCRWVTAKEQARNRRSNHMLEYKGEVKPAEEWAEIMGINSHTLLSRIRRDGWPVEKAIETPARAIKSRGPK